MPIDEDSAAAWDQAPTLDDPRLFHNRELSLLSFQERVLGEAKESSNPLLERLNFLTIFGSNIDEFFMVRVAGLKQKAASGIGDAAAGGMSGTELLEAIRSEVVRLTSEAYRCLREDIRPELDRAGIVLVD
jgi:polyphosphate kinase